MAAVGTEPLLPDGQVIAGHRVERFLGQGGMGQVYLCRDLTLKREAALKIIASRAVTPEQAERFLKEAQLASQIHHPNVVTVYSAGQHGPHYFMLMRYVKGENLAQLVRRLGGPLPHRKALRMVRDAAAGLAAAHRRGLIHRDIKPLNIMVDADDDNRVVLMDFGLARSEGPATEMTPTGAILGTPAYMSPEQWHGSRVDKRSDIYSLGATAYFLLTARVPYPGPPETILAQIVQRRKPTPVHEVCTGIPRNVSDLIARALALEPGQRVPDATTLAREIDRLLGPAPDTVPADPGRRPAPAPPGADETTGVIIPADESTAPVTPPRGPARPPWLTQRRAASGAAGVLLGAALVGLVALAARRTGGEATGPGQAGTKPAERPGMVWVPTGDVPMNTSDDLLRRYAEGVSPFQDDPDEMQAFLTAAPDPPSRTVRVPGFWIDRHEVTKADYARFVRATRRAAPQDWEGDSPPAGKGDHPVVWLTHEDALAYAAWAGKKLPTNEQWVRAFRGSEERLLPWGNTWDASRANVLDNPTFGGTSPVLATPKDVSPFGVLNLVGNVDEMMRSQEVSPRFPERLRRVVTRGSNFGLTRGAGYAVASCKKFYDPDLAINNATGFRCVIEEGNGGQ